MLRRLLQSAVALFAVALLPLVPVAPAAAAATHPVVSQCNSGWYVNSDEEAMLPKQVPDGFLFDGPSLVHRALGAPVPLASASGNGAFVANVSVGVPPLFKMETLAPYSTVNKTSAGTYWSSKIASGPGSQGSPVASLAALAALAPYNAASVVYSFGVGYANDTGNKAVVSSITFGANTYSLLCPAPSASPSASASASASPSSPPVSVTPTPSGTVPPAGVSSSLPLTGTPIRSILVLGAILLMAGAVLYLVARHRRVEFR